MMIQILGAGATVRLYMPPYSTYSFWSTYNNNSFAISEYDCYNYSYYYNYYNTRYKE